MIRFLPSALLLMMALHYSLVAQRPERGTPPPVSSSPTLVAGTDYVKPAIKNTAATIAASPCGATENKQQGFSTDSFLWAMCTGSVWEWFHGGLQVTPPPASGWSWVHQSTATVTTYGDGTIYLEGPAGAGHNHRMRVRTATAPYSYEIGIIPMVPVAGGNTPEITLGYRQSSDGKLHIIRYFPVTGLINNSKWTNETTSSTDYATNIAVGRLFTGATLWLWRLADNSTNRVISHSLDGGNTWQTFHTIGRTDFLTADQVFFGVNSNGTSTVVGSRLIHFE